MIIIKALSYEEITKDLTQIGIGWCFVKVKGADIFEIGPEFLREVPAEILCTNRSLLL